MQFNSNRSEKQNPMQPWDFFPSLREFESAAQDVLESRNNAQWIMFAERLKRETERQEEQIKEQE
jgi:hypothetical protein